MTSINQASSGEIKNKQELVDYFSSRETKPGEELIGTEHEKIVVDNETLAPPSYWGEDRPDGTRKAGIRDLMLYFVEHFGWQPVDEFGNEVDPNDPQSLIIGLLRDGASISLEPAGQFELSGAPLKNLHETSDELDKHLAECDEACRALGLSMITTATNPTKSFGDVPIMPKERYEIMVPYMGKHGGHGKNAMTDTTTVQVNLGYTSEEDMVKKLRVALALQPIATAMFANSPFTDGKPNGYQSIRSFYWTDTNPIRTGMLDLAFEEDFGYEKYVDWVLDNIGVYYGHDGHKVFGLDDESFRDFANGKLAKMGRKATIGDWANHLAGIWTEARLKPPIIEMRGSDNGPPEMIKALPTLWVGILYDQQALDEAYDLIKDWTKEERHHLRREVPKTALQTPFAPASNKNLKTVQDVAKEMLRISYNGLRRRAAKLGIPAETKYLSPLIEIAETGRTLATRNLEKYEKIWGRDITALFNDCAYGVPARAREQYKTAQVKRNDPAKHNAAGSVTQSPANTNLKQARKKGGWKKRLGIG